MTGTPESVPLNQIPTEWTHPVQIRRRAGVIEIRDTVQMGGLVKAYYVDDDAPDEPHYRIELDR